MCQANMATVYPVGVRWGIWAAEEVYKVDNKDTTLRQLELLLLLILLS